MKRGGCIHKHKIHIHLNKKIGGRCWLEEGRVGVGSFSDPTDPESVLNNAGALLSGFISLT